MSDDISICDTRTLFSLSPADRCDFVRQYCGDQSSTFDFSRLAFCGLGENYYLILPLYAFFLLLLVRMLAYTSDEYISAAIAKASTYLHLSESLAGSTLLAFSNGASDVITALVASSSTGDDSLVMGSLFGAALFTTTVAMGVIILCSPTGSVQNLHKVRFPAIFVTYFLAIGILLLVGNKEVPYLYLGLFFFIIYISYVLTIEWLERKDKKDRISVLYNQLLLLDKQSSISLQLPDSALRQTLLGQLKEAKGNNSIHSTSAEDTDTLITMETNTVVIKSSSYIGLVCKRVRVHLDHSWHDKSKTLRGLYLLEAPLHLLVRLTIPPVDEPMFSRWQLLLYPFTSVFFCMSCEGWLSTTLPFFGEVIPIWTISLVLSCILLVITLTLCRWRLKPTPRKLYLLITGVVGLFWLDVLVSLIVDIIAFVQLWTDASSLYLGMTFLGIGNSCIDLFVDYLLAKRGFEAMAINGVFAGQMFNLLVGFALSCIVRGVKNLDSTFHIFDWHTLGSNKTSLMVFLIVTVCAGVLITYVLALVITGGKFGKGVGVGAIVGYCLILLTFTLIELLWHSTAA